MKFIWTQNIRSGFLLEEGSKLSACLWTPRAGHWRYLGKWNEVGSRLLFEYLKENLFNVLFLFTISPWNIYSSLCSFWLQLTSLLIFKPSKYLNVFELKQTHCWDDRSLISFGKPSKIVVKMTFYRLRKWDSDVVSIIKIFFHFETLKLQSIQIR